MSTKLQITILCSILAVGLGLRLYSSLTAIPLRDARTYECCAEDYRANGGFARAFSPVIKPPHPAAPGYLLLLAAGSRLNLPAKPWGAGLNMAFGMLTIIGVWLISKTAFDSPELALAAAAIAATMPSLAEQDAQIMRDPAYIMFAIYAIYFSMRHCVTPRSCNFLWFALCAAAAAFTRREGAELLVIWVLAQAVILFSGRNDLRMAVRRAVMPALAGAAIFLAVLLAATLTVSSVSGALINPLPGIWFGQAQSGGKP